MMESYLWSKLQTLNLVREVKQRKCLWDISNARYLHRDAHRSHWKEISKQLNLPVAEVKKRWRSLRDMFRKEMKKTKDAYSKNNPEDAKSRWTYYNQLLFLEDTINRKDAGYQPIDAISDNELTASTQAETQLKGDYQLFDPLKADLGSPLKYPGTKEPNSNRYAENEDYLFLLSLLPYLRDVPRSR